MGTKRNPWERREGEGTKPYEAFKVYLELGEDRSLEKVRIKLGKSQRLIERWSSQHDWVKRAQVYDDWLNENDFKKSKKEREKMRKNQIAIAMKFQNLALKRLNKMDEKTIDKMKDRDVLEWFLKAAEFEDRLRETELKENPRSANENVGHTSFEDVIVSAYRKRMEEGDENVDEV